MQWFRLFDVKNINANNFTLIVSKAIEIKVKLEHEGYTVKGAMGRFTRKKTWNPRAKIVMQNSEGKQVHNLEMLKRAPESKSLIATLYAICHLCNVTQQANLFYNDNKGLATSIATKHGPEKSEYMKKLILVLEDKEFIESLSAEISRPLPEDLTTLHLDIIAASKENNLSAISADKLLKKHNISYKELEQARIELLENKDVDNHRIPDHIQWPKISLPDHTDVIEDRIHSATIAARSEIESLKNELEITKGELVDTRTRNDGLISRGLWSRIWNKIS